MDFFPFFHGFFMRFNRVPMEKSKEFVEFSVVHACVFMRFYTIGSVVIYGQ